MKLEINNETQKRNVCGLLIFSRELQHSVGLMCLCFSCFGYPAVSASSRHQRWKRNYWSCALKHSLFSSILSRLSQHFQDEKVLKYANKDLPCRVAIKERSTLKITVKVFLSDFDAAALESATRKVLEELGVSELDSLIVAFPPSAKSSTEKVRPLWAAAEQIYREGLALSVGVSDLDTAQLRDLHSWAEVKPSVNQVNLDSCCVIPQEMQEFAKANNIQLLTHSDPKVLLDHEGMARVLKGYMAEEDIRHWSAPWVARYSVLVKCRGFLQSKGYIASLVKEP
ncbi:glutamate-cysteine ligase modifier subunit isoform X2 [Rhipicephalus microplus]|uniref:glutamate-cysteine ligase modifier subunit isoform X2 n=1 Tax=Rhipicephalus microplus TaxID=6941 RepID=UPI003F6A609D